MLIFFRYVFTINLILALVTCYSLSALTHTNGNMLFNILKQMGNTCQLRIKEPRSISVYYIYI